MASRQNRESRSEYPTGHNKGNERAGDEDKPRTFGAPIGMPKPSQDTSFRDRLLATKPSSEEVSSAIKADEEGSRTETEVRQRAENEAANRRTSAPVEHQTSGTEDLSAEGAARRITGRQKQIDEEVERQSR